MIALVVMLTLVIAFFIAAALTARGEQEPHEDADTRVWRRLIDRHDQETEQ